MISVHNKHREGGPGTLWEPSTCGKILYPMWPSQELCAVLRQRERDPLSLLHPSTSGDWLWQSRFVRIFHVRTEEARAMGGICEFHRLLTHLIDLAINDTLTIVAWCLRATAADDLPVLAVIQLAERCRTGSIRRAMALRHLLHSPLTCPSIAHARHLRTRHPVVPAAQQHISLTDINTLPEH